MNLNKIIILIPVLVLISSCAALETADRENKNFEKNSSLSDTREVPNQFGWDSTNCMMFTADGHCMHQIGVNILGVQPQNQNNLLPQTPPVETGITPSNCAHIMADGTCAHPL